MKRLAWWATGVGLGLHLISVLGYTLVFEMNTGSYIVGLVASEVGRTVFTAGVILLAATVIADAITKSAAAREGP